MFTHDAPAMPPGLPHGWKDDPASNNNRQAIHAMIQHYTPSALFHGHYHLPYTSKVGNTMVYGLGADRNLAGGTQGNNMLLDTDTGNLAPAELADTGATYTGHYGNYTPEDLERMLASFEEEPDD